MFKSDHLLILLIIVGLIAINLQSMTKYIFHSGEMFIGSSQYPGKAFLPLRDHLKGVRFAGFYTDLSPKDRDIDVSFGYIFQRTQFALAPTLLDYHNPWNYEYTVVYLYHPELSMSLPEGSGNVVVRISNHILLLEHKI